MSTPESFSRHWMSAAAAVAPIRHGARVLIGSGCATPQTLVEALASRGSELYDIEIIHILTFGVAPYARRQLLEHFRHIAFFIGPNVRQVVNEGVADYTPIHLSQVPQFFRARRMHLDAALVQVSPPDAHGFAAWWWGQSASRY